MTVLSDPIVAPSSFPSLWVPVWSRLRRLVLSGAAGVGALRLARRDEAVILYEIRRLEELSPHLLTDIGVRKGTSGQFVVGPELQ